jgi:prephenate dehydrogenase
MNKIGIIGLGLIGGSLGLSLQKQGTIVLGLDDQTTHQNQALELGLINTIADENELLQECTIIIVATPTIVSTSIIKRLLDNIKSEQIIVDMGSTKSKICEEINQHPNRKNFVAAHPIAGTENSGPQAAIQNLFDSKKIVICDSEYSEENLLQRVVKLFQSLNSSVVFMNSKEHDKHLAYISHLSHICSFALGLTVLDIEKDEQNIFNLAGSGFSSTARLAKSSPQMWESIAMQNKENLLPAIESYIEILKTLKQNIEEGNSGDLISSMQKANEIRKIIKN